ncbi:putative nucleic acid-binding Zn-ribbon protein [Bradyrhizobium sp. USDA 4474]
MFQLFLRARTNTFLRDRFRGDSRFRARSPERDAKTDQSRIEAIMIAIEDALRAAEREQSGLNRRVDDVLARAAVTLGNGSDEYLEREALDNHHQDLLDREIQNGQRRLKELGSSIAHYKSMKAAVLCRFPDYRPEPGQSH